MISFHEGCSTDLDFLVEGFLVVADFFEVEDFFGVDLALRDNLERVEDFFCADSAAGAGEARGDGSGEDIGLGGCCWWRVEMERALRVQRAGQLYTP